VRVVLPFLLVSRSQRKLKVGLSIILSETARRRNLTQTRNPNPNHQAEQETRFYFNPLSYNQINISRKHLPFHAGIADQTRSSCNFMVTLSTFVFANNFCRNTFSAWNVSNLFDTNSYSPLFQLTILYVNAILF